jgi:Asp-tRNA(Asn)/Glu-tRNA(Gln) amidotransferase A subunit family amidase
MDPSQLHRLGAFEAARAIAAGEVSAEQLVQACLARIREVEPAVQAWQFLDEAHALAQARARDADRAEGRPCGPLHGVPVGVKDIIDTADMPTEDGTPLHAGRTPERDAGVVSALRAAGAVILGKTVTTECAAYTPGKTRNPHDGTRTPGGSSSGSAAAVAAGMVPLAIGTQTNGSVIRPASYCGVYGFKPTFGLIPRHGILKVSRSLDTVGLFARSLEDLALAAEPLVGHDERDPDTRPRARMPFAETLASPPPMPPRVAFVKTPLWERTEPGTREAFAELVEALAGDIEELEMPPSWAAAWEWQRCIMEAEMAFNLDAEWERGRDALSPALRQQLERGRAISALEHQRALARVPRLLEALDDWFARFDAIVTPATPGVAPGAETTGDPTFCTFWSLTGLPALSLPLLSGAGGLPLGVQLVGARSRDARLLRTARWLQRRLLG